LEWLGWKCQQQPTEKFEMHPHLEESLQRDIDLLRNKISHMAGLAERALRSALQALAERNRRLAYSVIFRDQYLDELETELDRLCLEFLVRQQPAGLHLRFVYTTIQLNKELERIGDYAESIAKQALSLSSLEPPPSYAAFLELGEVSIQMLQQAVQSFLSQDADLAWRAMPAEERANSMRNAINADLAEQSRKERLPQGALTHLMTAARRLERVADQAKNICEDVIYLCTGEFMKHKGAEVFRILFIDSGNGVLSRMAEAIGNALKLPRLVFSSAAGATASIDPPLREFMAAKSLHLVSQPSAPSSQSPEWESYQVIVALDAAARDALPVRGNKPVVLTWRILDAPSLPGSPEVQQPHFQSAFNSLESHIQELVAAIQDQPEPKN
jgi:phosphate transport system protein